MEGAKMTPQCFVWVVGQKVLRNPCFCTIWSLNTKENSPYQNLKSLLLTQAEHILKDTQKLANTRLSGWSKGGARRGREGAGRGRTGRGQELRVATLSQKGPSCTGGAKLSTKLCPQRPRA